MKPLALLIGLALFSLLLAGCTQQGGQATNNGTQATVSPTGGNMEGAKTGDTVKVDYVGALTDGKVFDTSVKEEAVKANLTIRPSYAPLEFTVGAGQMIAGFDKAVVGMKVGDEKTVTLPPEDAYGNPDSTRVIIVERSQFGADAATVNVGMAVATVTGAPGKVTAVNETHVTIDFNHELAGKTLVFRITMREITPAKG